MRRKIPNTGALVAFEAAARHESFTKAAEDLAMTQSAVCRQISSLETYLGVPLFRRTRRGVRLTDAGLAYSRQVSARLEAVEQDTLSIMAHQGRSATLELAVVPTFATQWLMPRLAGFIGEHADITVNLTTRTRAFLFADTQFDAAIYFGDAHWPGTEAHYLMRENVVPVCSPRLLKSVSKQGKPVSAETIATLPLLQQGTRPYAWRHWFESAGVKAANDLAGPRYELFSMLAQAARHEIGVALIPPMMIEEELASGRLVIACNHTYASTSAYYLMTPEQKAGMPALRAFSDWLDGQAAQYRAATGMDEDI
ncbi:LysR family transcriptional regulator [Noviherbaspirillum aerium]|uniref:LysR family transcriptional regulator n=1 Tax=Noviherbaspirillum aerium TaxID=2588497 RepID=UPI00124C12AB|nr:LysR family transcriptional regulator [Noviherbaspirillum aerium]